MRCSERAFGRGNRAGGAGIVGNGHAQSATESLEHRFGLVVGVVAAQVVDVRGDGGMIDQALEKLAHQIDIEFADAAAGEINIENKPRPAGEIDHHAR